MRTLWRNGKRQLIAMTFTQWWGFLFLMMTFCLMPAAWWLGRGIPDGFSQTLAVVLAATVSHEIAQTATHYINSRFNSPPGEKPVAPEESQGD